MLVTSIFSFSHNVFKRLLSQGRQKAALCGKGLRVKGHGNTDRTGLHVCG